MIDQAPIKLAPGVFTPTYKFDNKVLWDKHADLLRDTEVWVYIKEFQRARNGCGAFLALKEFYLGPNMVNGLASAAKGQITKAGYTDEAKRWNFKTYVALHKAHH